MIGRSLHSLILFFASLSFSLFFLEAPGFAQSSDTLQALENLQKALEKDQSLEADTKKALQGLIKALGKEREDAKPSTQPRKSFPSIPKKTAGILEKLTLYGDFRIRHESNVNQDGSKDRHRERIRLRVGANYKISDEVTIGARIRTGNPDDPNSPHVDFGSGGGVFDSFEFNLDRAFLKYSPPWLEYAEFTMGKFGNPVYRNPISGGLAWDGDVQPEGIVGVYKFPEWGPLENIKFVTGAYVLQEQSNADDAFIFSLQGSAGFTLSKNLKAQFALGYYHVEDTNPDGSLAILNGDNAGNAVNSTATEFLSEFGILNPVLALNYTGWDHPIIFSAEYLLNTRAEIDEDQGWAFGTSVGSSKEKGDWKLFYQWQVVEQDAVFSPVAPDDFLLQTNFRGSVFGFNYKILDTIGVKLWTLVSSRDKTSVGATTDSDRDQWRIRLEFNISF